VATGIAREEPSAAPSGSPQAEPAFLVGSTRSGSTLLGLLLGHHPAICCPGEFELAIDLVSDAGDPPPLDVYREWLALDRHFLALGLAIDPSLDYRGLVNEFLLQLRRKADPEGKPIAVAVVHRHYDRLLHLWPQARLIHVVRDPRDVCASWLRLGWVGNAWAGARAWQAGERLWDRLAAGLPPERRCELRFEDLLASPREELERLCRFLGVPFDEAMFDYPRDTTYGPLDPSQAGKWRGRLAPRAIRQVEAGAGELLERRGYARSGLPALRVGALQRSLLALEDRVGRMRGRRRTYGWRLWLEDGLARRIGSPSWNRSVRLRMHAIVNSQLQ
jgi:hypothetical protein